MKDFSPERLNCLLMDMSSDVEWAVHRIREIGLFDYDGIYGTDISNRMYAYVRELSERNEYASRQLQTSFVDVWEIEKECTASLQDIKLQLTDCDKYIKGLAESLNSGAGYSTIEMKSRMRTLPNISKGEPMGDLNVEESDLISSFTDCDESTKFIIKILDDKIVEKLSITDIEERKKIIQALLENNPGIFKQLYVLNSYSGADYEKLMYNVIFDIEQEYRGLTEEGVNFLYNLELQLGGDWRDSEHVVLDANGNVIAIKVHDVGDDGYTIGPGIYVKDDETFRYRVEYAETLEIDWNIVGSEVPMEKIETMFSYIEPETHSLVKRIERVTGIIFTTEQYEAVFSVLYLRPALYNNIIELVNTNANQEEWCDNIMKELNDLENAGGNKGWQPRIEYSGRLYYEGIYE